MYMYIYTCTCHCAIHIHVVVQYMYIYMCSVAQLVWHALEGVISLSSGCVACSSIGWGHCSILVYILMCELLHQMHPVHVYTCI